MKLNVLFMGTPEFSTPTLDLLNNHPDVNLIGAISMPSRAAGRGKELKDPEVVTYCKNNKIDFWQAQNINKEASLLAQLENFKIDLIIVLAFAQFLGKRVLEIPRIGSFNIHTSLLPKYRGAAPIQYALLNGDQTTGVSIQRMVKKMDAGDLVLSKEVTIQKNETGGQLYTRLKYQAALSTNKFINMVLSNSLEFTPQNENNISFAPTLKKEDGFLDFKNTNAQQVINRVRALKPWPGTHCLIGDRVLKVHEVSLSDKQLGPGEVQTDGLTIQIGTLSKTINLELIQLPGKTKTTAKDFLNGFKGKVVINP